jgi:hypothetical protein
VANVVDTTLANCWVFMRQHAHDAKVASAQYKRANGIPSPSNSDIGGVLFVPIIIQCICNTFLRVYQKLFRLRHIYIET